MDAAGCQTETLELIRRRGGEYVVCVKGNQPTLRGAIAGVFDRAAESGFAGCDGHASVADAHGRHEERSVTVVHDPEGLPAGWAGVGSVALVCRDRQVTGEPNESTGHYYLTSLRVGAAELAGYIRGHWHIESMHWVLDVAFHDDLARLRTGHGAENMATVRHMAVNLVRDTHGKHSLKVRRKKAAWSQDYLETLLRRTA